VLLGLRIDELWFFCVPHIGLDNELALSAKQLG